MGPVRPASILVGTAAFVVLASPGGECFVARRGHHHSPTGYTEIGDTPSLLEPQQGLIREESSIPGVSIWTPKTVATEVSSSTSTSYRNPTPTSSTSGDDPKRSRPRASRGDSPDDVAARISDDYQDESEGVSTMEGEDEEYADGRAAPRRLSEDGGGSDSQEDDDDEASSESEEKHSEEGQEEGDEEDESDSCSGSGSSRDSLSEDEGEDSYDGLGSAFLPASFGRHGGDGGSGSGSSSGDGSGRSWRPRARGRNAAPSVASKYEGDERECVRRVKELWQDRVLPPLSPAEIEELTNGVQAEQQKLMAAAPTEWDSRSGIMGKQAKKKREASAGGGGGERGRRDEGSDGAGETDGTTAVVSRAEDRWGGGAVVDDESSLGLLFRLFLAEMHLGNGPLGGLNNRWIDQDALLQLRGTASLAHHPEYLHHTANLPRVTRGVRLVAPEATHSIQEALARSLAHCIGSKVVVLDAGTFDSVKAEALTDGVPKKQLTTKKVASALLELADEDDCPFVVFLKDKGSAVRNSRGLCQRLTEELQSGSSRVLFVLSTVSDPSVHRKYSGGDSGDDATIEDEPRQGTAPAKNFFFLQTPPPGDTGEGRAGAPPGGFFVGGSRVDNGGSGGGGGGGGGAGGRGGGQHQQADMQSYGGGGGRGSGMPQGGGPPIPHQMLEQMLRQAMKNMEADAGNGDKNSGGGGGGGGRGGGGVPPGLAEALGEALNDDGFKKTLEQIGKSLGEDPSQGFSIMFSAEGKKGDSNNQGGGGNTLGSGGGGEASQPWGAVGSKGSSPGDGKGNPWQSSSSLSWLTNLRRGIRSGDEGRQQGASKEPDVGMGPARGADGSLDSGGGINTARDLRGALDWRISDRDMQMFERLFESVVVEPPRNAVLRQHWNAWVKEEEGKHNMWHNRQVLEAALQASMLACPELERLDPLLVAHRLTEAETGQVVLAALKVELSQMVVAAASTAPDAKSAGSSADTAPDADHAGASSSPQPSSSPCRTAEGRLVISRHSMETALGAVCKAHVPRPGQPVGRTREEVTALVQNDRHEQALISNVILPKDIGVTYDMIGGLGGAKELLRQSITYPLRFPHLYNEGIAREAVKGVLLFGPPGTGKTMLAKAVATEGGATFLSVDSSVIENKWLGESEKNARAVFTLARRLAPCVVFIDEVDSILSSREKSEDNSHGTLTSVKTTLMQEWDGLRTGRDRVVVIASTNRPFDLDEAVLRRMPRRILVDLPDAETREEILKVSMAKNRVDASVNFTAITAELEGFTGSDIKEVCREAVVRIAHEKAEELDKAGMAGALEEIDLTAQLRPVTMNDFLEARKKLTASVSEKGRELSRVLEWNEEYGEVKKKQPDASAHHLSMYL